MRTVIRSPSSTSALCWTMLWKHDATLSLTLTMGSKCPRIYGLEGTSGKFCLEEKFLVQIPWFLMKETVMSLTLTVPSLAERWEDRSSFLSLCGFSQKETIASSHVLLLPSMALTMTGSEKFSAISAIRSCSAQAEHSSNIYCAVFIAFVTMVTFRH